MATTWIKPLHVNKGKTIAQTITDRTDYAENPDKTRKGELVTGYECSPRTTDTQFLLSKQEYERITGRNQGNSDILAYHIRQAFKPSEITPELANEIGRELALRFTKGNYAFIVATHIDKSHIHNHIIINSTNLNCDGKFHNFKQSIRVIRRISDNICFENGLFVVENPKPAKGNYGSWLGGDKKPSERDKLKLAIDAALVQKPIDFNEFLKLIEAAGYEVKKRGNRHSFRGNGKGYMTLKSLKDDYTEEAIREIIGGRRAHAPKAKPAPVRQPQSENLLTQIQRLVKPKGSVGYDRWAAVFNLKQLAKTYNFLQEYNLLDFEDLAKKAQQAKDDYNAIASRITAINARLPEITELQKHIGTYSKTKDVYAAYRKSGWSKKFYSENREKIEEHKEAKRYFDALGLTKLPTIKTLQAEYAALLSERKPLYGEQKKAREYMLEILLVKQNAEALLNHKDDEKTKENERE